MNIIEMAVAVALAVEGADPEQLGDGGRAVGVGQMHDVAVKEANRIIGMEIYKSADRKNPSKVYEMALITLAWHRARHPERDVIWLASKWRNPYSKAPDWHLTKLKRVARAKGYYP